MDNTKIELLPINDAMRSAYQAADDWVVATFKNGEEKHPHFPMIHHAVSRYIQETSATLDISDDLHLVYMKGFDDGKRYVVKDSLQTPVQEWLPIETAPTGIKVLLYGGAPIRFGVKDELGNWRASHGGRVKVTPTHWQPLPTAPKSEKDE